ncbi:MAG: phosphoglycerate dehydrogenase [Polyangiaceae bacterium]|jgi:D-3-phosphoglycerate dehydrogenase / 2-oxoglutarate reductase|nr:phosphoglycerate dehydrogenase [Polyangiaceae bacterium]
MSTPVRIPPERRSMSNPLRVLLLENIHPVAVSMFEAEGLQVETAAGALGSAALIERLHDVDVLGIRSKTHVTDEVLAAAPGLLAVGCFCIGTNQVDLRSANAHGVPVFNAPFSNTRSVAELILAESVVLARQLSDRAREMHEGVWKKVAAGCYELRGKTLGIVGYGHIGSQLGVLAEGFGMRVIFYDIATKLPMGNNRPCPSLGELLRQADFVTLHVPETPQTKKMIGAAEFAAMKRGAFFLNASRGTVVDISALAASLREGHVAGTAVDVFPEEPEGNGKGFVSELQGLPNVLMTPHIGGSTVEAQEAIGREVATSLIRFLGAGTTTASVNFPQVEMPVSPGAHRILNVHRNVPGVMSAITHIVSEERANIRGQMLSTDPSIGYLVMDLEQDVSRQVTDAIRRLPTDIRTRIVY